MAVVSFRVFGGEIPRLPAHLLPEGAALYAANCDLAHGELRGLRGNFPRWTGQKVYEGGQAIKSVYTEDGASFFAWTEDVDAVRSQVVDDQFYRIYYTIMFQDGSMIKVARTKRNDNGVITPVINTSIVHGNFQPPENSNPSPVGFAGALGPDSWVLGVQPPRAQGVSEDDLLIPSLVDSKQWPGIPRMQLRVLFFIENPTGQIVAQLDVSNNETANRPDVLDFQTGLPFVHPNVFVSNDIANRGNRVQDLLSLLGPTQRPYKYYFFAPPQLDAVPIGRTILLENTGLGSILVTYGASQVDPTPNPPGDPPAHDSGSGPPPSTDPTVPPPDTNPGDSGSVRGGDDPGDTGGGGRHGGDGGDQA